MGTSVENGRGQPLSLTLSFGENPWFDRCNSNRGKIQRCDWSENAFFVCAQMQFAGHEIILANHSAVFPLVHQTTEVRQSTVRSASLPISRKDLLYLSGFKTS